MKNGLDLILMYKVQNEIARVMDERSYEDR